MELTCTLAQAVAVKTLVGAQILVVWVRSIDTPTKVASLAFLDPKFGQLSITFASEADRPLVTQVTSSFANNVEVSSISPV